MSALFVYYLLLISVYLSIKTTEGRPRRQKQFQLSIIHFNDFHARFEETSPSSTQCRSSGDECIGGFARLYTAINQIKADKPDSILLNAGDDFQGTLWYNTYKWNITQYFMNKLPIDAQTLGNHEFDDGVAGVAPYMRARFVNKTSPMLVANMNVSNEPSLDGLYNKSLVIRRGGEKIGIIGVLTYTTPILAKTENVTFEDEILVVQREADKMTAKGINKIIVLSHIGIERDRELASRVKNIDVIVGGHSHTLLYPKAEKPPNGEKAVDDYPVVVRHPTGETVLIVQASAFTKYLGHIIVNFDDKGSIKSWQGKPIYLDKSIIPDQNILDLLAPYKEKVDRLGARAIGSTAVLLDKSMCPYGDCNIGNMITDAFVEHCVALAPEGSWTLASVGLMNNGGMRTNIDRGNITYGDLIMSQPFNNLVQTFEMQGKYITEMLEFSAGNRKRLQVSGLHVVFDMAREVGNRIVSAKIRCSKCVVPTYSDIDPEEMYSIVSQSFLTDGGDGYEVIKNNLQNLVYRGVDIDIMEDYIERYSPIMAEVDGRMVYWNDTTTDNNRSPPLQRVPQFLGSAKIN